MWFTVQLCAVHHFTYLVGGIDFYESFMADNWHYVITWNNDGAGLPGRSRKLLEEQGQLPVLWMQCTQGPRVSYAVCYKIICTGGAAFSVYIEKERRHTCWPFCFISLINRSIAALHFVCSVSNVLGWMSCYHILHLPMILNEALVNVKIFPPKCFCSSKSILLNVSKRLYFSHDDQRWPCATAKTFDTEPSYFSSSAAWYMYIYSF